MGFFDKLKAMVGIGQPKLELTLSSNQVKRGTSITGKAVLTGGTREVAVKEFILEHVEVVTRRKWSDTMKKMVDVKDRNTINKMTIAKNDEILKPGETMEVEIDMPVSSSAMNSGHPYAHEFKISADTPGLDPSKKTEIYIL